MEGWTHESRMDAIIKERDALKVILKKFSDLDCCTGYSLGQKDYPAFWDALDEAREALRK